MKMIAKPLSKQILSLGVLSAILFGCGELPSSNNSQSGSRGPAGVGVIGGAPVEKSSPFEEKVLYLATGAKIEKKPDGSQSVSWKGLCTASAISPRVVLTAAHCVVDQASSELYIILTKNPSQSPLNLDEWYSVQVAQSHEKYIGKLDGFSNDLALLLLSKEIPPRRILKLAQPQQVQLPQALVTVGYGTTSESSDPAIIAKGTAGLHYVHRTVDDFNLLGKTFRIDQNDHKGFCNGDSGGPGLIFDRQSQEYYILGVVSNTSMESSKRAAMDPKGQYSLCIGQGNYVNVLHPEFRQWIQATQSQLERARNVSQL